MVSGRSWSMVVALMGALALAVGLAACGGSSKAHNATTSGTRTHARHSHGAGTTSTGATGTTTVPTTSSTTPADGATTTSGSATTPASGGGSGSGGTSGGASLGGATTTTTRTTTTSTSTACKGEDCQGGSPTVPGSVPPVNGKCHSGYVYVAAQDGGPALCVPITPITTTSTTTQ